MKIATRILDTLNEELPKNLKIGKLYKKVSVDGETFKDMTLKNINPNKSELTFASKVAEHTFNYIEQDIKIK